MTKRGNAAVFVPHLGCRHRCSFCDQNAVSGTSGMPGADEVAAVCERAIASAKGRSIELAFFGGSFTAIPREEMTALLKAAQPFLGCGIDGIRLSTRPDAVDGEVLALLRAYGVTAVELGAQSMDDAVLEKNRRGHTADDTRRAAALIRENGFELGLQMMPGLDGADEKSDLFTAQELISLAPDTVRIYPTLVLDGTELAARWRAGTYRALTLDAAVEQTAQMMEMFEEADVRIIRVGLHPSPQLEARLLAGPYHPAFRELCESRRMLRSLLGQLGDRHPGKITVAVRPQDVSRMTGQHRQNIGILRKLGWEVGLLNEDTRPPLVPRLIAETEETP